MAEQTGGEFSIVNRDKKVLKGARVSEFLLH
jgi:hypothetical protein